MNTIEGWLLCSLLCLYVVQYGESAAYTAEFNDAIKSCKNFDNKYFEANLGLVYPEDSKDSVSMMGNITVVEAVDEGMLLDVEILKATGTASGYESMVHMKTDLCESMKDEDLPWSTLFETMGVSSCPIKAKTYPIENLHINLEFAKNLSGEDYAGDYDIVLILTDTLQNIVACFDLDVQVSKVSS